MTFQFLKKLINEKTAAQTEQDIAINAKIFRTLFSLYFSPIFMSALYSDIVSEAARHAVGYFAAPHLFQVHALEAFDLASFGFYPIERWPKDGVANLLIIASAKILYNTPDETQLTQFHRFLDKVCERSEKSCTIVAHLSDVVGNLYHALKMGQKTELYPKLDHSHLFHKILSHVAETIGNRCWLAVSTFIKVLFVCEDLTTIRVLVRNNVFPVMAKIFNRSRGRSGERVIANLLLAVEAACSGLRLGLEIDGFWTRELIPTVLQYAGRVDPILRPKACRAFEVFSSIAEPHHMLDRTLNSLVNLLKSQETPVVYDALKYNSKVLFAVFCSFGYLLHNFLN